jgi:hypothetical protein
MTRRTRSLALAAAVLLAVCAGQAEAGRLRYHYVAADGPGTCFKPDPAMATGGERVSMFGTRRDPAPPPPVPTVNMTYRHPCTGQTVTVPLCLPPDSTPRLEYRYNRIIYNYGSETVEVVFLTDGTVDVVYNSGLLRAP